MDTEQCLLYGKVLPLTAFTKRRLPVVKLSCMPHTNFTLATTLVQRLWDSRLLTLNEKSPREDETMEMVETPKAVVLLSGGADSTTCLAMAVKEYGRENVKALSLFYGQKHKVELDCAKEIAQYYGIEHEILQLPNVFAGAGSTLVDSDKPNPEVTYEELAKSSGVSPTYVPFRNGNLISVATAMALRDGAEAIYYGPHSEDARAWAYPDCTAEFNGAMANAIYVGTYHKVRLITPLQWMTKAEVIKKAHDIGAPMWLTHSCYNGERPACGKCPTCIGRIEAFKSIGLVDPIEYATKNDWEDCATW